MLKKQYLIISSIFIFTNNTFTSNEVEKFELRWKKPNGIIYTHSITLDSEAYLAVFNAPRSSGDMEYVEKYVMPDLKEEERSMLRNHLEQAFELNLKYHS